MSLRLRIIISFVSLAFPILFLGGVSIYFLNRIAVPLKRDIPQQIEQLTESSTLGEKALLIRYYDEVLTQSARNYALTGDGKWKVRYEEEAPKLDMVIKDAKNQGDEADKDIFSDIDASNTALVSMEEESMVLAGKGDLKDAVALLDSPAYASQKQVYQTGLTSFITKRGVAFDKAVLESAKTLKDVTQETEALISKSIIQISSIILFIFLLVFGVAWYLGSSLIAPLITLHNQVKRITQGSFEERIPVTSRDELGELARAFNTMTDEIKKSKEQVEQKVKDRTKELEKLNAFMTNRELMMIELKKRLQQKEEELIVLKNQHL